MVDLFEDHRLGPGWDEMFGAPGMPRDAYEALHATLQPLSSVELRVRATCSPTPGRASRRPSPDCAEPGRAEIDCGRPAGRSTVAAMRSAMSGTTTPGDPGVPR
jgi:hypothetical protein